MRGYKPKSVHNEVTLSAHLGVCSGNVAWAMLHAMEHTAQHSDRIQITRQLWEQYKA